MSLNTLLADVWTDAARDKLPSIFLWVALALAVLLVAVGIFVRFKQANALKSYITVAISLAVGFAVSVTVTMLALEFIHMQLKGRVYSLVLWPTVALGASVVLASVAIYMSAFFGKKARKITSIVSVSVIGAALIALLVCLGVYLASGDAEGNNGLTISVTENALLYVCAAVLVGALAFSAFFLGRKDKKGFDTKAISYAAVCIALSFALSYLRFVKLPQGGSITAASLLPLMIYAYMFGVKKGIFAGFIYGILQAVQDPYIIHPAQFLLDYPIAFAFIGLAGLFANAKKLNKLPQLQFAFGAIVAGVFRYLSHVLSGAFAFTEWAFHWTTGEAMNPWLYSLGYNSFVFADIAIAIAVGILVFSSKSFVKQARKFNAPTPVAAEPVPMPAPAVEEPALSSAPAAEQTESEAATTDDKTE